jgi:hypothetical protein
MVLTLFGVFVGDHVLPMATTSQAELSRKIRLQSSKEIARYSRIQRQTYGLNHVPYDMLQATSAGLFVLLDYLSNSECQAAFIELSRLPAALSQRFKLGKSILGQLETAAKKSAISLPPSVLALFKEPEKDASYDIE